METPYNHPIDSTLIEVINTICHMLASGKPVFFYNLKKVADWYFPKDNDADNAAMIRDLRTHLVANYDFAIEVERKDYPDGDGISQTFFERPFKAYRLEEMGNIGHVIIDTSFSHPNAWEQYEYENHPDIVGSHQMTEGINGYPKNLHHIIPIETDVLSCVESHAAKYGAKIITVRRRDGWRLWERAMAGQDGYDTAKFVEDRIVKAYTYDVWRYAYAIDFGRDFD